MSVESKKQLSRRFLEHVLSERHLDEVDEIVDPNFAEHEIPAPESRRGDEAVVARWMCMDIATMLRDMGVLGSRAF